ncbi:MAG: hypothetical protein C0475_08305 [Planctomyces sp.]|nr:hypothetical protein [Planctomyces sp.]MBA4039175.1 hypothetical protein [Planctomyces sp.]
MAVHSRHQAPESGPVSAEAQPAGPEGGKHAPAEPSRDEAPRGAAVADRPRPAGTPPALDHLPPYRVLLHNDDVNEFTFVIRAVIELVRVPEPRAEQIVAEAHTKGLALVKVCHRELAELYAERFSSKGLTATVEPAT